MTPSIEIAIDAAVPFASFDDDDRRYFVHTFENGYRVYDTWTDTYRGIRFRNRAAADIACNAYEMGGAA